MHFFSYAAGYVVCGLLSFVSLLLSVAFFTLVDRKLMGGMQRRVGPNIAGPFGVLQPLVDGLKLLVHGFPLLRDIRFLPYFLSPLLSFLVALGGFLAFPDVWVGALVDSRYSLFFVLSFAAYGLFGVVIAGWSSGSRYAFLGGMRSTAQMLAYEILLTMIVAVVVVLSGSLSLEGVLVAQLVGGWWVFSALPAAVAFLLAMLAETNRTPFDLMEAEAEIVAGFNVEYSALVFSLFFLGEYASMLFLATLFVFIFCAGPFLFGTVSAF